MKRLLLAALGVAVLISADIATAEDHGYLFGTVTTEWGDEYTGRIRWDKNEGFWDDILDATKDDDYQYRPTRRHRGWRIRILGFEVFSDDGNNWSFSSSSQLRFGHIEKIEPRSRGRARVHLKSGEIVEFEDSGSDLGSGNRGIWVDVEDEGIVELKWRDLDVVTFRPEPDGYEPTDPRAKRLYGRVTSADEETFVGFIVWDADEIYTTDILDGDDEDDRDREIPFGRIASIKRRGRRGSLVTLKSGRELRLHGSNDIDDGQRGIAISTMDLGRVDIDWEDFDKIEFLPVPSGLMPTYDQFDGGRRLYGTLTDDAGDTYTGEIAWDNDEKFSWEFLNGERHDIDYDIEFGNIAKIERKSRRACIVTLKDGTTLRLRGSNDVDDDNEGIFVETRDGNIEEFDWDDFEVLVFKDN